MIPYIARWKLGESLLEWLKKIAQCKLFWIEDEKDIGGGGIYWQYIRKIKLLS